MPVYRTVAMNPSRGRKAPRRQESCLMEYVTRVIDGDTFETRGHQNSVRLSGVNAPELAEPGGWEAKRALASIIRGERVRIETVGSSYGRRVAKVWVGHRSVNAFMLNYLN